MSEYFMNVSIMKLIGKYFKATFYWRSTDGTLLSKFFDFFYSIPYSTGHVCKVERSKWMFLSLDKQHNSGGCYYHYQYHLFLNLLNNQRIPLPLVHREYFQGLTYCIYVFPRSIATGLKFLFTTTTAIVS